MMTKTALRGMLINEQVTFSLAEISQACSCRREWIIGLVDEGVLAPFGEDSNDWQFPGGCVSRARTAARLHRDLKVNLAGVALALELLEELETLRGRLQRREPFDG